MTVKNLHPEDNTELGSDHSTRVDALRMQAREQAQSILASGGHTDLSYIDKIAMSFRRCKQMPEIKPTIAPVSQERVDQVRAALEERKGRERLERQAQQLLMETEHSRAAGGRRLTAEIKRLYGLAKDDEDGVESQEIAEMVRVFKQGMQTHDDYHAALGLVVDNGGAALNACTGDEPAKMTDFALSDLCDLVSALVAQLIHRVDAPSNGYIPVSQVAACCQALGTITDVDAVLEHAAQCANIVAVHDPDRERPGSSRDCRVIHINDMSDLLAVVAFFRMNLSTFLMALRRLLHLTPETIESQAVAPPSLLSSEAARKNMAELWALAPGRAIRVESQACSMAKGLQLSLEQGHRQAKRRGFEVGAAELALNRGHDTFHVDVPEMRHQLMEEIWEQPLSLRRKEDMVHDLPLKPVTKIDMLHELRVSTENAERETEPARGASRAFGAASQQIHGGNLATHIRADAASKAERRESLKKSSRWAPKEESTLEWVRGGQFYVP